MKTEPISMGEIARNAFMKTPDSFLDEPWANAATAVIAEHERRKAEQVKPDPFAAEKAAFAAGKTIQYYSKSSLEWLDCYPCPPSWDPDYAYRVKPDPALVPLGPDDVPPFSAIRWSGWETTEWALVLRVTNETVYFSDRRAGSATLNDLRAGNVKINRSIPLTGKWDADAWTACFKEVQP